MKSSLFLVAAFSAPLAFAQEEVKPDPLLPDQLKILSKAVTNRKMAEDAQAIEIIADLRKVIAKGMHKNDWRKLITSLSKVFVQGPVRPPTATDLYVETATALGECGPNSSRALVMAFENKRFKDKEYLPLRAHILVQVGATVDPKQIDFLIKTARRSPDDALMAAAGRALASYHESLPIKKRREIVKDLLITYGEVETKARDPLVVRGGSPQDFTKQNNERRLGAIEGPWTLTLQKLTGQKFTKYYDWQRWQNKNQNWKLPKVDG